MNRPHLERAAELEAAGVEPYKIRKSDGLFTSNYNYPFFTEEVPSDNRVRREGDTLLSLHCSPGGSFRVVFPAVTLESKENKSIFGGGNVRMFNEGIPIIGQCSPPMITRDSPETKVYAVYEVYGPKKRQELASYCYKDDKGVLVINTKSNIPAFYRVGGKDDPGHTRNTLYLEYVKAFSPADPKFNNLMVEIYTHNIVKALELLEDPTLDYKGNDMQLFRELWCGRLTVADTLRIYQKLIEKHSYVMTEKDVSCLANIHEIQAK